MIEYMIDESDVVKVYSDDEEVYYSVILTTPIFGSFSYVLKKEDNEETDKLLR